MAVLSETDRARVWRGLMRYWSRLGEPTAFKKSELRAAVDATDDWIDSGSAGTAPSTGYNSALPQPFRGAATTAQKTALFCAVAAIRVSVEFARQLFGEVD